MGNGMTNRETSAWNSLIAAITTQIGDISTRILKPVNPESLATTKDSTGAELPTPLVHLYSSTNGINLSGYLPDQFTRHFTCSFSLIPAEEITTWHTNMLRNCPPREGIWRSLPHWFKVLTVPHDADGIWNSHWIPFATDGAGGVQFFAPGLFGGVLQYDPSSFGIRRCSRSLVGYFLGVAKKIRSGKLRILNV